MASICNLCGLPEELCICEEIAKEQQKTESVEAVFLVSWSNIENIMHYPNREGYDFPSEFETDIGF